METVFFLFFLAGRVKFKSYYVVWKHISDSFVWSRRTGFKSYYVVWKQELFEINRGSLTSLNRTMQYGNAKPKPKKIRGFVPFKSYYVVWKPLQSRRYTNLRKSGLNRTMQYGNTEVKTACDELLTGLNRTMQYGNP